jgi:hypothetical protein
MRRYMALLGLAFAACVLAPAMASAQVVIVGRPAYYPPVVTYSAPPVVTYSSPAPIVVPQSTTTYSYYSTPPVVTYSSPVVVPQSVVTYSSPAPYVTYSAPIVYSSPSTYTTRSYYGFGILRPRGWYTETYVRP